MNSLKNLQKEFNDMTPLQKDILLKITHKIQCCEGKDMPEKYWCDSCKAAQKRIHELFVKFKTMNNSSIVWKVIPPHTFGTSYPHHPGFSDFSGT